MATKASLFNMALGLVGQPNSNDPEGSTEVGPVVIRQVYDICRTALLEQHPWNFATKEANLTKLTSTPLTRFNYKFSLESDTIRPVRIIDSDSPYKEVNGKEIYCDDDSVILEYIFDQQDVSSFSPLFTLALATYVAIHAEYNITKKQDRQQELMLQFREIINLAKSVDSQRDSMNKTFTNLVSRAAKTPYGRV